MRAVVGLGLALLAFVPGHSAGGPFGGLGGEAGPRAGAAGSARPTASARVARAPLAPGTVLPPAEGLARPWEILDEPSPATRRAPDLRRWGVRALRVRHYALRGLPGSARVCSVEVWAFRDTGLARAARLVFVRPGWRIERAGALLLFVHGASLTLGEPPRKGLFPACQALGDRLRQRADRLVEARGLAALPR